MFVILSLEISTSTAGLLELNLIRSRVDLCFKSIGLLVESLYLVLNQARGVDYGPGTQYRKLMDPCLTHAY